MRLTTVVLGMIAAAFTASRALAQHEPSGSTESNQLLNGGGYKVHNEPTFATEPSEYARSRAPVARHRKAAAPKAASHHRGSKHHAGKKVSA